MRAEYIDIINMARSLGISEEDQIKYILATAEHETNGTMEPVLEAYWVKNKMTRRYGVKKGTERFENWGRRNFKTTKSKISYYPYYGRGYVQITWRKNYKKFSVLATEFFGEDINLVRYPNKAMDKSIALFILVYGMINGSFTGKKLSDYINSENTNFISARRIINGRDKARHIANIAKNIEIDWGEF